MDRSDRAVRPGQSPVKNTAGFTLVELVVVVAVLGVLAAVAAPRMTEFFSGGQERSYETEHRRIQAAVRAYYAEQNNPRHDGKRQYPILGRAQTDQSTLTVQTTPLDAISDDGNAFNAISASIATALWNPLGGTQGADLTGKWIDGNSDGVRTVGGLDRWSGVPVVFTGVTYNTDPRYYAIDFEELVRRKYLPDVPESASIDNAVQGSTRTYNGSYIWYVGADGTIRSLYSHDPTRSGYVDGVFP